MAACTEAFARRLRTTNEVGHLADDPCAQLADSRSNLPIGLNGDWAQGARGHDVGSSRRHEQAFCQAAPLAFPGETHEPVRLQRVQMVIDLLPSQVHPRGQCRRRGGLGQLGEESTPPGLQGDRRRRRISNDFDIELAGNGSRDNYCCHMWVKAILPRSR